MKNRYARVASYFYDGPTNQSFGWYWTNRFVPKLDKTSKDAQCKVMAYNTMPFGCP